MLYGSSGFRCDIDSKKGFKLVNKKEIIKHYVLELICNDSVIRSITSLK